MPVALDRHAITDRLLAHFHPDHDLLYRPWPLTKEGRERCHQGNSRPSHQM